MQNIFLIQLLAIILCTSMVGEITVLVGYEDLITAEADSEMEHEESKEEKEKEKTTSENTHITLAENSLINKISLANHQDRLWNTPFIDYQTPPPKQI